MDSRWKRGGSTERRIKKILWPSEGVLTFPDGLDTYNVSNAPRPTSLAVCQNAEIRSDGSIETRRGRTLYITMTDTTKPVMGMWELVLQDGTKHLLLVQNGLLYKYDGTLTNIPIRLYKPYPPYPDNASVGEKLNGVALEGAKERSSGSVGANLVASRMYEWALVAVKGAGKTTLSDANRLTLDASPNPVDVTFHGCYGADTYEMWRRHSTDGGASWSTWGRMATGLTHTTTGGKTLIQWVDDGSIAPDTAVTTPASNTTELTLTTTVRVDFETWDGSWNGENAAYFVAGNGYCRTDGTNAEVVTPSAPSSYLESAAGINALGDVTWAGHTARGLIWHHNYLFFGDAVDVPNVFYWSRANDPSHVPSLAAMEVPTHGGRILDFKVKDAQLGVGTTTGIHSLVGRNFQTIPPSTDVYFSEASDKGIASERSMVRSPMGWLQWVGSDKRVYALAHLQPDPERTDVFEIGKAIRPTIDSLTDQENAEGLWANDSYVMAFPADGKVIRLYETQGNDGMVVAPVIDTATSLGALLLRRDGTILGAHATDGYVYKLFVDNTYTDNGSSYTFRIQTQLLDMGDPKHPKKFRWVRVFYDVSTAVSLTYRLETIEGVDEGTITLAGSGGYDEGLYDEATYDPWNAPYYDIECENAQEGTQIQVTLSATSWIRIKGLAFLYDRKRA